MTRAKKRERRRVFPYSRRISPPIAEKDFTRKNITNFKKIEKNGR
jgi:hypothetical protein